MSNYSEVAMNYFKDGYNCAQAVVAAFCDRLNIDFETVIKMSSSFGGGMGRLREVCGAVSGMFIVAGLFYGYDNPQNKSAKTAHYKLIQELAAEFKDANGSIICRELLGLDKGAYSPVPDDRTREYYSKRPCKQLVGMAAEIIEKYINKMEDIKNENCISM